MGDKFIYRKYSKSNIKWENLQFRGIIRGSIRISEKWFGGKRGMGIIGGNLY